MTGGGDPLPPRAAGGVAGDPRPDDALRRAVAAYAEALALSCEAARHPSAAPLANAAVAAHLRARAWAEETVRRAAAVGRVGGPAASVAAPR